MINLLTSPVFANLVQDPVFQVMSEGTLKAIGRPTFTLLDKNADPNARKYAAAREFLYQTLCLSVYFAIVFPVFKKGAYKVLRKFFKNQPGFEAKNFKAFELAKKEASKTGIDYTKAEGAMTAVSILGSAATLTIFAPQVVNKILHPIMKYIENNTQFGKATQGKTTSAALGESSNYFNGNNDVFARFNKAKEAHIARKTNNLPENLFA